MNVHSIQINGGEDLNKIEINRLFNLDDYINMNVLWIPYGKIQKLLVSHPEIASASIVPFPPGKLTIIVAREKPELFMIRPWGYYVLGKYGQYIRTVPPHLKISPVPIKFSNERMLFDECGRPMSNPWKQILSKEKLSDNELMIGLGYRDLMTLRDIVLEQVGMPKVQYVGYHKRYGLMLKCENEPLMLIGYGNDLMIHFTRALKILSDPKFPFGEDKYVDIRFDEYQCVNDVSKLEEFSEYSKNTEIST
jgi:hypothetical protein